MWKTIKITTLKYCILKTALLLPNLQLFSYFFKKQSTCEGLECSLGGGNGNSLQYSCQENPMDRGAWWTAVHGVSKSQTQLERLSMHAHRMCSINTSTKQQFLYEWVFDPHKLVFVLKWTFVKLLQFCQIIVYQYGKEKKKCFCVWGFLTQKAPELLWGKYIFIFSNR